MVVTHNGDVNVVSRPPEELTSFLGRSNHWSQTYSQQQTSVKNDVVVPILCKPDSKNDEKGANNGQSSGEVSRVERFISD